MKLYLTTLREGRNEVSETLSPERLGLDDEVFTEPVTVAGTVDWSGDHADVRLHIEAPAHFACDRCAEEFDRPVAADAIVQVLIQDPPGDEEDDEVDGIVYAGRRGTNADLTEEIVDALMLEVPLRRLCSPDCKGLCPYCYTNLNEGTCEHAGMEQPAADEPRGETIADKLKKKQQR